MSGAQLSALFIIWSAVGIVAEVPSGALADRFSRRNSLVAAGILQALSYLLWVNFADFAGFAAGFVLWGLGGAMVSGAFEALLYEGLEEAGAKEHYASVNGAATAAGLVAQLPAALAATVLFKSGGYELAGWVSIGTCLAAAALATRLPEGPRKMPSRESGNSPGEYLATLRSGFRRAASVPALRTAIVAASALGGLDALEEYFGVMAQDWGVAVATIPVASLGIPLAGAVGAAFGGPASRLKPAVLGGLLGLSFMLLGITQALQRASGLILVAAFYAVYRLVLVVVEARVQDQIEGSARATITSVAGLGTELSGITLFGVWALGGLWGAAALGLAISLALPLWLSRVHN